MESKSPHSSNRSSVMPFCNSKAFPCCGDTFGDSHLQTRGATGSQLELAILANASGAVVITSL